MTATNDNDMQIPERFDFHDWYLEKYNEEYPYTYSEMQRKIAGKEGQLEQKAVSKVINEYKIEGSINSSRAVANALKEPYKRVVESLLAEIGIIGEEENKIVMDMIPLWNRLGEDKKEEVGVTIAGRYRLAKFCVLMDELSKLTEDETQ